MNTLAILPVRRTTLWRTTRIRSALLLLSLAQIAVAVVLLVFRAPDPERPVFTSIAPPDRNVSGIAYDGASLWITIDGGQAIYRIDPATGVVRKKLPFLEKTAGGSAWDGHQLWQLAWESKKIYQLDLQTGAVGKVFRSPGTGMCSGMTFDGTYLWVANFEDRKIYQIDQNGNGAVVRAIPGLHESTGLAWDGKYLWEDVLVGAESHDDAPEAGFFRQRDVAALRTMTVVAIPGIGPGTSDWLPGVRSAHRFWWADELHNTIVRVDFPPRGWEWRFTAALAALCIGGAMGLVGALRDRAVRPAVHAR